MIIIVCDDGKGFDPSKEERNSIIEHVGIRGMKERARVLHSNVTISSKPGEGTTVTLVLPLNSHILQ